MMYLKIVEITDEMPVEWNLEARDFSSKFMQRADADRLAKTDGTPTLGRPDDETSDAESNMVLHLRLWENILKAEGYRDVLVYGPARVFVMSESGKTIDRITV